MEHGVFFCGGVCPVRQLVALFLGEFQLGLEGVPLVTEGVDLPLELVDFFFEVPDDGSVAVVCVDVAGGEYEGDGEEFRPFGSEGRDDYGCCGVNHARGPLMCRLRGTGGVIARTCPGTGGVCAPRRCRRISARGLQAVGIRWSSRQA